MTAKQRLEATLWDIANALRGKMSADDFRDYILGFIFYKYLSEKMELYADEILHPDGITYDEIKPSTKDRKAYLKAVSELSVEHLGYFLEPEELFKNIVPKGEDEDGVDAPFILDKLTQVLNHISDSTRGHESEDDFANLFEDLDLTSSKLGKGEKDKNNLVVKVLRKLATVDFELNDPAHDVLGDAYEYLIAQFASGAGKKAGEFYTPQEVSTVLARIVTTGKKRLKAVYDPTCGSGSLLLRVKREVLDVGTIYGQEMNPTTFNLCRMNMIMHDVHYRQFDVRNEDTLERPQHLEHRFEAIVANPPFSAQWNAGPTKSTDDRFSAPGKLAPKTKADFAFLLHMLHHLDDGGTLACILPHGALFREGAERDIRKYLIENLNCLEAVIGLPDKIFFGTDMATCIVVLRRGREKNKGVLFVDGSALCDRVDGGNKMTDNHIDVLVDAYRNWQNREGFSAVADLATIKAFDYDLYIPKYAPNYMQHEAVSFDELRNGLADLSSRITQIESVILNECREQGLPNPLVPGKLLDGSLAAGRQGWKEYQLKDLLNERKEKNSDLQVTEVFSVAKEKGVINQLEHLGRSYASDDLTGYKVVRPGDVVYTKSPTSGFPFGIVKQSKLDRVGIVSVLYAVYKPKTVEIGRLLDYFFSSSVNTYNYLLPLAKKGAKNTLNIGNSAFLDGATIWLPANAEEHKSLVRVLSAIEEKVILEREHLAMLRKYQQGMQQLIFNGDVEAQSPAGTRS